MASRNFRLTFRAVRAAVWLVILALVEISALPTERHNAAASGCAVTRTAIVGWSPRIQKGTSGWAGSSQVI